MAYDKVVDSAQLDAGLTSVANGIRSILGSTAKMGLDGMPTQLGTAVSEISTQADLMAQLSTILEGKAGGGGSGGGGLDGFSMLSGSFTYAEVPTADIRIEHEEVGQITLGESGWCAIFIFRFPIDKSGANMLGYLRTDTTYRSIIHHTLNSSTLAEGVSVAMPTHFILNSGFYSRIVPSQTYYWVRFDKK